jgi:hypothetical protein
MPEGFEHTPEQPTRTLEIANVLMIDIVSYSLLPMDQQSVLICELQELVSGIPEFLHAQAGDHLICLPTGDGMALVFFGDPTLPIRCAQKIALGVKNNPQLRLRMGIHTGPVYRIADINANRNIAGGGINLAQRVMDCGDAGHILLSKTAAEILLQLSTWKLAIQDLGEVEVKHGVVIHIFNAFTDDFGNSQRPSRMHRAYPVPVTDSQGRVGDARSTIDTANPFDPWTPAVPPSFVGRAHVLARLQDALDQGRSVSLVGDWRIGKSSLLKTCMLQLEGSGRPAKLLSGEGREGASPSVFVECATGRTTGEGPDAAADVLSNWARQVKRPGLIPALLVDEFDALVGRFDHRFFERLRGMLDSLCVVASSRRELDRVYLDLGRTSPFHNRLELLWLGLLDLEAAEKLANRSERLPLEAHTMVGEWAGRHPFFIQLFGRKLVDSYRYGESLEDAREQFLAEGASRLRELWATLTANDRQTLRAAVETPQPGARSLRQRGLLTEDGRPFGRLLVEWLQEEQS